MTPDKLLASVQRETYFNFCSSISVLCFETRTRICRINLGLWDKTENPHEDNFRDWDCQKRLLDFLIFIKQYVSFFFRDLNGNLIFWDENVHLSLSISCFKTSIINGKWLLKVEREKMNLILTRIYANEIFVRFCCPPPFFQPSRLLCAHWQYQRRSSRTTSGFIKANICLWQILACSSLFNYLRSILFLWRRPRRRSYKGLICSHWQYQRSGRTMLGFITANIFLRLICACSLFLSF